MRWKNQRRSRNIIDRRGQPARRRAPALGGGVIVLALLAAVFFGVDPSMLLETVGGLQQTSVPAGPASPRPAAEDEAAEFVSVVLADTELTWQGLFQQAGERYQLPKLVLFTDSVTSACGMASAAAGPFYCPGDSQLYLDLGFLAELQRMGAKGDLAVAYVIAHEVGHHVQNLAGTARQVQSAKQRMGKAQANVLQVSMELQADCYAGVWAHHANGRNLLEAGDIEEGLSAASSVGDDHLQRMAGRRVTPESFTHGSSKQRMQWFGRGFESGNADACDTFGS
jgi:predicted metalloprotease